MVNDEVKTGHFPSPNDEVKTGCLRLCMVFVVLKDSCKVRKRQKGRAIRFHSQTRSGIF
jgi:hypothetical protein